MDHQRSKDQGVAIHPSGKWIQQHSAAQQTLWSRLRSSTPTKHIHEYQQMKQAGAIPDRWNLFNVAHMDHEAKFLQLSISVK
jgi:hypothetical protein